MEQILLVLWESALAFVVLFIVSKILGKKQIAQLEFTDYAIGISIGSIAAQMAFDNEFPFYTYIIAMVVFAALDILFNLVSRKSKFLKNLLTGKPMVLIEDGLINYKNIKKSKLTVNQLISAARYEGYFDISQIAFCYFETSGDFSFMPKTSFANSQKQDLNIKCTPAKTTPYIVIDGKLVKKELKEINKDEKWAMSQLKVTNKKELNQIALALLDNNNKPIIYYKNK